MCSKFKEVTISYKLSVLITHSAYTWYYIRARDNDETTFHIV